MIKRKIKTKRSCAVCGVPINYRQTIPTRRKLPEPVCRHCQQEYKRRQRALLVALPLCGGAC